MSLHITLEEGLHERIVRLEPVSGGSFGRVVKMETEQNTYFLKWLPGEATGRLEAEEVGLERLVTATRALRIPRVIGLWSSPDGETPATGLVLEWIDPCAFSDRAWERLGTGLAELHQTVADQFGFEADNFIGASRQINTQCSDWSLFFRDCRLVPQIETARLNGRWHADFDASTERLLEALDDLLPHAAPASLVHGDLWSGNVLCDDAETPVLIDPAVYYADADVDLAMSSLFGGFRDAFYNSYRYVRPASAGYETRKSIYNLYHLINHLNLFGDSYAASVQRQLDAISF